PAVSQEGGHSYASERELLFNMIFRMRNEIDSLRSTVESLEMQNGRHSYNEAVTVDDSPCSLVRYTPVHDLLKEQPAPQADAENIDSGMTLEDTERETIKRALERNEGRRKATAQELNISERTLYRKIKEYGLE
ncbi:helix-turn-helix domain-containing protein, partial [uncultured Muribaculum sp.]